MTPIEFQSWLSDPARRTLVMGVLNVTPDSFSDGGRFSDPGVAIAHAREMAAAGATLIDIGGESTRPGSQPVPEAEQIRRIVPVVRALANQIPALLSIDTTRAAVAEAALDAGAHLVNDISGGLDDPALLPMVARRAVPVVLMHMQGTPATMQINPTYADVVGEIKQFLRDRVSAAESVGIDPSRILIDPGIGFGKRMEHNLELLRRLAGFTSLGRPMVVGVSRKGFIGRITGEDLPSGRRFGTAAAVAWSIANGAAIVRVHDVAPMAQVVRIIEAIQHGAAAEIPRDS
ncbi:MAG TPA: dihydropteroate synthase [Tepidisphaeraceae bacterium]